MTEDALSDADIACVRANYRSLAGNDRQWLAWTVTRTSPRLRL